MRFNEAKATQAAARLLRNRGGRMSYMKLIKLLYFADREALLQWNRSITTDVYVSMDNGPVVSKIYNLIQEEDRPGSRGIWSQYISHPNGFDVELLSANPPLEELSEAEENLLDRIFEKYGHLNRWDLVKLSHDLPEWQDPHGSAFPIEYRDIFRAEKRTASEIAALEQELHSLAATQDLVSPV